MKKEISKRPVPIPEDILEKALNSLPRKDLPPYIEARVMASVRNLNPPQKVTRSRVKQGLQWASLTMGVCVFALLGALMAGSLNLSGKPGMNATEQNVEMYDLSLMDYFFD